MRELSEHCTRTKIACANTDHEIIARSLALQMKLQLHSCCNKAGNLIWHPGCGTTSIKILDRYECKRAVHCE